MQRAAGEAVPVAVRHAAAAHHPRHPPGDAVGALRHPEERDAGGPRPQQWYGPPPSHRGEGSTPGSGTLTFTFAINRRFSPK